MKASVIKRIIDGLKLPANEFVLFGGSTLALAGARDAKDIDLFVSHRLYDQLISKGWKSYEGNIPHLARQIDGYEVQAFSVWKTKGWQPSITEYLENPDMISGLPCMPISELYKWKEYTRRDKDLRDLELIKQVGQKRSPGKILD